MMISMQICPYCTQSFNPMPGRRGYEQIYCSPRCRRAEGKRREAAKYASQQPGKPMMHEPRNEPHNEPMDDEWSPYVDDLCRANWRAHIAECRYDRMKARYDRDMGAVMSFIDRIEARMGDI